MAANVSSADRNVLGSAIVKTSMKPNPAEDSPGRPGPDDDPPEEHPRAQEAGVLDDGD